MKNFRIAPASRADVPSLLNMIRELADYEGLSALCVATQEDLSQSLFGQSHVAEAVLGWVRGEPAAFALFFHNFSTFLGRKGLYLEDLFVRPDYRRRGYGKAMLVYLARLAVERDCGRFDWAVLDWNAPAIGFYESLGATLLPDWRITRLTGLALARLAKSPAEGT